MLNLRKQSSQITERIFKNNPDSKFKTIHSYAKIYPDFIRIIRYKRPVVIANYAELSDSALLANEEQDFEHDSLQKSINRTKTAISDYVLCNKFTHFATFTFDAKNPKVGSEENRHDFKKMSHLLQNWLNTEQITHMRKFGAKFAYLIVPERHKNGAWHFHALLKNYRNPTENFYSSKNKYITVKEIKTEKRTKNREFFTRYNLGRSEIMPIRDTTKMANYIKKYITKELITEPNAKRYWASRNLVKPEIIENIITIPTQVPEIYHTQVHEYHDIYEIPTDSEYFQFLKTITKVELSTRKEKFKWFLATH